MLRRFSVLMFALILITGCTSGNAGNVNSPEPIPNNDPVVENENNNGETEHPPGESEQPSGEAEEPSDETDLHDFVLQESGQTLLYQGLAEYGHNETLEEVQQADNGRIYVFHGVMNDGTGITDENGDPLSFQREVHVTDEAIISSIESEHYEEIRKSLFREKILLQKPIEVNKSWTEQVEYDGVTYDAVSTITSMDENDEGNIVIAVETVVDNMDGYPDNQYKERIKLEEGKGVISFENNDVNFSPPLTEEGYTFGYGLAVIQ